MRSVPELATIDQVLPASRWEQFAAVLLEAASLASQPATILTEHHFLRPNAAQARLLLVTAPGFSALLEGQTSEFPGFYRTQLYFGEPAIAAFLNQWQSLAVTAALPLIEQMLAQADTVPAQTANDPSLQNQVSLKLFAILAQELNPTCNTCQPPDPALEKQLQQERLLDWLTTQIRQSLELPVLLETTVEQVQQVLDVDRLLIYQFVSLPAIGVAPTPEGLVIPSAPGASASDRHSFRPRTTYESLANSQIASALNWSDHDCWHPLHPCFQKFCHGYTLAVSDTETTYANNPCLLRLWQQFQVRSILAIPILTQEQLWGLLIAHDCDFPFPSGDVSRTGRHQRSRQWQPQEQRFLQQIADHLAIAIQQAQLYTQLQQQKQTLEQRVIERTQALYDALLSNQSANRAKSDFLSTMSHELRTPLTCVIGMSATLLRWSLGPLNEKQRSYLKTIHDNGEHLLELINEILDLSQAESGKAVLNLSQFSLSQLAGQCLRVLQEKAQTAGVDLKAEFLLAGDRDQFIADQRRARQILFNLLTNAIKFTPSGGKVLLRLWREADTAFLQVEDTGIGIPASQQPLLFQKFQQLDTSYTRSYEGMGLGLALTKQLVELHRGRIEVESTEGIGSIFTVEIPLQSLPNSPEPSPNLPHSAVGGRIVLLENQEETANLICDILTAASFQVVWLIEPSTALEQIQFLQPIAVITALDLQGMDGYELLRRMRQHSTLREMKVLVLIDNWQPEAQFPSSAFGATAYLHRPIDPEDLLHKVSALLATEMQKVSQPQP